VVSLKKHSLTLVGGPDGELRVSASVLQEALSALLEGARQATRFALEGESVRKGPRPAWLEAACAIEVTALSAGSAVLAVEAPTLQEADPARFGPEMQRSLFDEHDGRLGHESAIGLFGRVLAAAATGNVDEVLADRPLLETCARLARVGGGEYEGIRLDGIAGRTEPIVVTANDVPRIEELRDVMPPPQATRVAGVLDTISASRPDVVLSLADGTKLPARLETHDLQELKTLFGAKVVISGVAHYRPSGHLLLVDVESVAPARDADDLFSAVPLPRTRLSLPEPVEQDATSGVSAFFGCWPGDESDDDLLTALAAIE